MRKISRRFVLLLGGALAITALTGCWWDESTETRVRKAVEASLKAAGEERGYNVEVNKELASMAEEILKEYLDEDGDIYEVTAEISYLETIYIGDEDEFGTVVFAVPKDPTKQAAWMNACDQFMGQMWAYKYGGNKVEIGFKLVKNVKVDGLEEPIDCMVMFAKRHYGEEGGDMTPPQL